MGLLRKLPDGGSALRNQYSSEEITVELVRGSVLQCLVNENQVIEGEMKAMKSQLREAESLVSRLRYDVYQAQEEQKGSEYAAVQRQLKTTQDEVRRVVLQSSKEEHQMIATRLLLPSEDSAIRVRMKELHDMLSRVEGRLIEVLEEIDQEQQRKWMLEDETAKEASTSSAAEKRVANLQRQIQEHRSKPTPPEIGREVEIIQEIRELEIKLDQIRIQESFVSNDLRMTESVTEDAADELSQLKEQLEAMSRILRDKSNQHHLVLARRKTIERALEQQLLLLIEKEETMDALGRQLDAGLQTANRDLENMRIAREQRNESCTRHLEDLEKRVQTLHTAKVAAQKDVGLLESQVEQQVRLEDRVDNHDLF